MEVPKSYHDKVDAVLDSLEKKREAEEEKTPAHPEKKYPRMRKRTVQIAVCILLAAGLIAVARYQAKANIFAVFQETIMKFFGIETEEEAEDIGVGSNQEQIKSKAELVLELQQTVIDGHNIYLLVQVTAPGNIRFTKNTAFSYTCFCRGENYNSNNLLAGPRSCDLFEVDEEKKNIAYYIACINFTQEIEEGSMVTACFQDLRENPSDENSEVLAEGMWSVTFPAYKTVRESIVIDGKPDMDFPYINTRALVQKIEVTPLGITFSADISSFPYEDIAVSDTTVALRLKMIDGSEIIIRSHDSGEEEYIKNGGTEISERGENVYQTDIYEFADLVDMNKVVGIYVEDLYIPVG